ncbi:MAG: zinc ribbon domain-containing protein [Ruminococcaceae bacterium]|nr:zinc ribbon domain-containing protein [Oscillospiraceae bacterium]
MDSWRKIAGTIMYISIALSSIGVLILSSRYMEDDEGGTAFLVLVGGAFLILAAHMVLGMFIELCNNVAELKDKNIVITDKMPQAAHSSTVKDNEQKKKAVASKEWKCSKCGTLNEKNAIFCSSCGNTED